MNKRITTFIIAAVAALQLTGCKERSEEAVHVHDSHAEEEAHGKTEAHADHADHDDHGTESAQNTKAGRKAGAP